mmetsp:Transcript_2852/g.8826  ORF Transcript_2852/g.8826 Transcript_2852/m.8826 type:complete len:315 (+) Transcript_2852:534-1478(+)
MFFDGLVVDTPEEFENGLVDRHVRLQWAAHRTEVCPECHKARLQFPLQAITLPLPALQDHWQRRVEVRDGDAVAAPGAEEVEVKLPVDRRLESGDHVGALAPRGRRHEGGGVGELRQTAPLDGQQPCGRRHSPLPANRAALQLVACGLKPPSKRRPGLQEDLGNVTGRSAMAHAGAYDLRPAQWPSALHGHQLPADVTPLLRASHQPDALPRGLAHSVVDRSGVLLRLGVRQEPCNVVEVLQLRIPEVRALTWLCGFEGSQEVPGAALCSGVWELPRKACELEWSRLLVHLTADLHGDQLLISEPAHGEARSAS